ncbi:MAG: CinA family protein [Actinomycetes bacterium]
MTPAEGQGADAVVARMRQLGQTLAVAESLTGGMVMAALTAVPGASAVLRGGSVVYATDTKTSQLGVDDRLLEARGPVDPDVALAMAHGVRDRWTADLGLATTGVAGPEPQDGHQVGEVYVAVAGASEGRVITCPIPQQGTGDEARRDQIRRATTEAALGLVWDWIER